MKKDKVNPYKEETQKFRIFEILKDLKWHCSECELPGSQPAKALQGLRRDGYQLEKVGSDWAKKMFCKKCGRKTPHRKLKLLEKTDEAIKRIAMPAKLRKRIIAYYKNKDVILDYSPTGRSIEIDHRIPEIRWKTSEENLPEDLTDEEIEERYMLLVREHNLLKSRKCEKCKKTGIRQYLLGIKFFYKGDEKYNDKLGCVGCGWHNPEKWREELNKFIEEE
ncbi:hypothetical protein L6278_02670 [Candidatus Parcubacteria bacterium]|nr:hypothetical protein [Patescibacteria group bacterium]MCG2687018.1 hypothetical protein [Candidatus Parcubacteria bacterium]